MAEEEEEEGEEEYNRMEHTLVRMSGHMRAHMDFLKHEAVQL